ncbi:expressed unknown protein [Ectocarpus siliculosus]|uniref:RRM domain-containing protein n=1 Tax=Ectocarpus siliculosus TaxID=2880 RepID=D8LTI3_ECTSI|nr:expressed unknown protein [Ectocarpus siliculosus]|eukprot:CBN78024.1 expressed unknown protein [Ectocarpus siliculosus]
MSLRSSRAPRVPYVPPAARASSAHGPSADGYTRRGHDTAAATSQPRQQGKAADGETVDEQQAEVTNGSTLPAAKAWGCTNLATKAAPGAAVPASAGDETRPDEVLLPPPADRDDSIKDKVSDQPAPTRQDVNHTALPAAERRRKPRQAWAQYVPPGRRGGGASSASSVPASSSSGNENHSSCPRPEDTNKSTSSKARDGGSSERKGSRPALKEKPSVVVVADGPAPADQQEGASEQTTTTSTTSSSLCHAHGDKTGAKATAAPPLESQASCPPSPAKNREGSSRTNGASTEPTATSALDRTSEEHQDGENAPAASEARQKIVEPPPASDSKRFEENVTGDKKEDQELPAFKPPAARYVPPGRRKALDAELAAAADSGSSGGAAAGDGMGPLWTSRAPVRVSQRERPSDRDASPARRPAPARVAHVVSGGMSAYGTNISEYSEEMSREQVEACTAVVSNFPVALPPGQRDSMLQSFVSLGGLVVWPRPDEALVTFATPALARQAVSARNNRDSVLFVELLSQARVEKRTGYRRGGAFLSKNPKLDVKSERHETWSWQGTSTPAWVPMVDRN